ncbi:MAG: DUF1648 domain-containing protein [Bacteroidota bacterium]
MIAILWLLAIWSYFTMPEIIPVHFNGSGTADSFGPRGSIFILPAVGTLVFGLLTLLNKVPHVFNYPAAITPENAEAHYTNATRMLRYMKLSICVLFIVLVFFTMQTAKGNTNGLGVWFMPFILGIVFIPIVVSVFKARKI